MNSPPPRSDQRFGLVKLLEWLVILAMGLLVLDVLWGVGSRGLGQLKAWLETSAGVHVAFLPNGQSPWTEELARFLLIWTSLLGAALAFQRGAHLGVDFLVARFHPDARKAVRWIGDLLVLVFAGLVLVKGGWTLVATTLASGQVTPALGLKKWIIYAVIPIAGLFVILFTLQSMRDDRLAVSERDGDE
ncbi:MAG: TRAP transporter small permease [Verrucomicrobia bacterium]|nr:TRAP transporter small permease [Verrucomicrobiota bacterium]